MSLVLCALRNSVKRALQPQRQPPLQQGRALAFLATSNTAPAAARGELPLKQTTASLATAESKEVHVHDTPVEYDSPDLHLTTRNEIYGREVVEELGVVIGTSARARNVFRDIVQRIRGVIGGSLVDYEEMFANATAEATHNAMIEAQKLGATAIVRTRYESAATDSYPSGVSCFVICYGTAVKDRKSPENSSS